MGETVGNYEILELLGSSEPGSLHKARRLEDGEIVALRFLPSELDREDERTRRFLEEARSSAEVSRLLDPIDELEEAADGRLFYCTPFRPGETVQRRLERGPITLDESIRIALSVCEGLEPVHRTGIVHRGVRPDNVLLTDESDVVLQGFGLEDPELAAERSSIGVLAYFAPEQLAGRQVGPPADVWGVGVVLYEMLTGRRPFRGETASDVARAIRESDLPPLSAFRAGIPPELEDLVAAALAKDPADRPESLEALRRDLAGIESLLSDRTQILDRSAPSVSVGPRPLGADPQNMIGRTIGPFRIEEKIGGGGMGVVYRARDERLDRPVALKFLPPNIGTVEEEKKRFIQEARAASALDHPNICTIYQIDEVPDGPIFIAMACYEGQTLKQKIEGGPVDPSEATRWIVQTAQGLAAAHERGIVHRDIKPANVIVTTDGIVKILDFGLSKVQATPSDLTQTGTILGTASYMSPEQARGEAMDARTDVWSLGVVFYELLTATKPFRGANELAVLHAIVSRDPEPAGARVEGLPEGLDAVLRRCLEKDVEARYAGMAELLRDVAALDDAPTSAYSAVGLPIAVQSSEETTRVGRAATAPPERLETSALPREAPKRRVPVRWIAATAAVLVAVALLAWWGARLGFGGSLDPVEVGFAGLRSEGVTPATAWVPLALEELIRLELDRVPTLEAVSDWPAPPGGRDAEADWTSLVLAGEPVPPGDRALRLFAGDLTLSAAGEDPSAAPLDLELRLVRLEDGARRTVGLQAEVGDLPELASDAVAAIAHAWGRRRPDAVPAASGPPGPSDETAARQLRRAREALSLLDLQKARLELEKARERVPRDPTVAAHLADVLGAVGQTESVDELLAVATTGSRGLPLLQRAWLRARTLGGDPERAQRAAALWDVVARGAELDLPDRLLRASSLHFGGRSEEAMTLLAAVRSEHPDDPRVLVREAEAAEGLGDRQLLLRSAEAAASAAARAEPREDWELIRGEALFRAGRARMDLGELDAARETLQEARDIFANRLQIEREADALFELGRVAFEARDLPVAQDAYDRAAQIYEKLGRSRSLTRVLGNLALLLSQEGRLRESVEVGRRSIAAMREGGDPVALAAAMGNLSLSLVQLGEVAEADELLSSAQAIRVDNPAVEVFLGVKRASVLALRGDLGPATEQAERVQARAAGMGESRFGVEAELVLSRIARIRGNLEDAERSADRALGKARESRDGDPKWILRAAREAGEVRLWRGRVDEARALLEESLEIHRRIDARRDSDDPRISLGWLELEAGRPERARVLLEEVEADLRRSGSVLGQVVVGPLLGEALRRLGQDEAALAAVEGALEEGSGLEEPGVAVPLRTRSARVLARLGQPERAEELLAGLSSGMASGRWLWELERRLAELEIDVASGQQAVSLAADLEKVEEMARTRGSALQADRAAALLRDMRD